MKIKRFTISKNSIKPIHTSLLKILYVLVFFNNCKLFYIFTIRPTALLSLNNTGFWCLLQSNGYKCCSIPYGCRQKCIIVGVWTKASSRPWWWFVSFQILLCWWVQIEFLVTLCLAGHFLFDFYCCICNSLKLCYSKYLIKNVFS